MSEETRQEAGFLIDGKEYPIPDINTFTLDEDELLWDYAGLSREDFVAVDPKADDAEELEADRRRKLRHPGLMRTLLHVAYQRGNPTIKAVVIKRLVGQTTLGDAMSLMAEEPGEEDPLALSASTSEPSASSRPESNESDGTTKLSSGTSGSGSPNGSDGPVSVPEPIGTGR